MMKSLMCVMLVVCVAMTATTFGSAWVGGTDNLWNTGANWNPAGVPSSGDTYIDGAFSVEVNANVPVHGSYTNIRNGATLTINADLTSGDDFRVDSATATMNAGTLTCDEKFKIGNAGGVGGIFNMNGGTVTMSDDLEIYSGNTLVYSGGSFTCPVDLELKSGTIKVIGYDAAGVLSINGMKDGSGGTFEFVPNASGQVTAITNTDAADFESQNLVVDLANLTGAAEIMLFDADVTMGAFTSVTVNNMAAGLSYSLSNAGGSGTDVVLSVVPEPATMLLLGLGGLVLRRRKRA